MVLGFLAPVTVRKAKKKPDKKKKEGSRWKKDDLPSKGRTRGDKEASKRLGTLERKMG